MLDSPIVPHLIQKLESKKENISFARVDSDSIDNLIKKEDNIISKLDDKEKDKLKTYIEDSYSKREIYNTIRSFR